MDRQQLNTLIESTLNTHPDIAERYRLSDPLTTVMLHSMRELFLAWNRELDGHILEPFIKSNNKTIIADAVSKGILPKATSCIHTLIIENKGDVARHLSAGRTIEDNVGRIWQLTTGITINPKSQSHVTVEQVELTEQIIVIERTEPFFEAQIDVGEYFCGLDVENLSDKQRLTYTPKFMNAPKGEPYYTLISDDFRVLTVMFGDSDKVGATVQAGDKYRFTVKSTHGNIDINELKQASLSQMQDGDNELILYFDKMGLVRMGVNPPNVSQLRLIASLPSVFDHNAVFMGNFEMLVRSHFVGRYGYMALWNETVQERYYGANLSDINHLHLAVVAKHPNEQALLEDDIKKLIATADSLFDGKVKTHQVVQRHYQITITGELASVHDTDTVKAQIKALLLKHFGKDSLDHITTFNRQEISILLRENITAFADRMSDFSVQTDDMAILPHEWAYLTDDSIIINLRRIAGARVWTL